VLRLCRGHFKARAGDLTRAAMPDYWHASSVSKSILQCIWLVFHRGQAGGHEMNLYWTRSEKYLLVVLALSVAIVGVLTALVMNQEHDQSAVADAPVRPTSQPALGPTAPQVAPAPQVTTTTSPPALAAPASGVMTPTQLVPPSAKPLQAKTLPRRRANPVPAPPPLAATHPVAPAPQTDPAPPARSDAAVKPGSPDGW